MPQNLLRRRALVLALTATFGCDPAEFGAGASDAGANGAGASASGAGGAGGRGGSGASGASASSATGGSASGAGSAAATGGAAAASGGAETAGTAGSASVGGSSSVGGGRGVGDGGMGLGAKSGATAGAGSSGGGSGAGGDNGKSGAGGSDAGSGGLATAGASTAGVGGTGGSGGAGVGGAGAGAAGAGGSSMGGTASSAGAGSGGSGEPIGGCDHQLLVNADFDAGPTPSWVEYSDWPGIDIVVGKDDASLGAEGVAPYSGNFLAWLGGIPDNEYDHHLVILTQTVEVPAEASQLTLSGRYRVKSLDDPSEEFDEAYLEFDVNDNVVWQARRLTNQDVTSGWVAFSHSTTDLSQMGGHAVTFYAYSRTDPTGKTSFWLDSLRLEASCGR